MSLPLWRLERIREIVQRMPGYQEMLLDIFTHPSTRLDHILIDRVPQMYLTTRSKAAKEFSESMHIGHVREDGYIQFGGNRLVPLLFELAGAEPADYERS